MYRADKQNTFKTCDEVSNAAVRKAGEFNNNFETFEKEICQGDSES